MYLYWIFVMQPPMHQHINMHHLPAQEAVGMTSPQPSPGNRWMANMAGNNGKFLWHKIIVFTMSTYNSITIYANDLKNILVHYSSQVTFLSSRISIFPKLIQCFESNGRYNYIINIDSWKKNWKFWGEYWLSSSFTYNST